MNTTSTTDITIPHQTYISIFLRFLKFGFLAWGGPVAQIAMLREEMVDEEKWITPEKFNRVLAIYQALPGPEAHELCVYFGMLARGRMGALLAGLGFMLPGFVLMLALSSFYLTIGIASPIFHALFLGMQPAVAALIVRAVHRIGGHALHDHNWLWVIAFTAALAQLLGINFLITLFISGLIYTFAQRSSARSGSVTLIDKKFIPWILLIGFVTYLAIIGFSALQATPTQPALNSALTKPVSLLTLIWSGLKSGLLTFGGAYTVIPFLRHDAVQIGAWMTDAQFLDGLALSSLLPAPLIIFSTFVGYIGGGVLGAVLITIAIFAPSFAFTMIGHEYVEKLVDNKSAHAFLDGITAGVVGLIAATALGILSQTVIGIHAWIIFSVGLIVLFRSKAKWTVAAVVLAAGLYGLFIM